MISTYHIPHKKISLYNTRISKDLSFTFTRLPLPGLAHISYWIQSYLSPILSRYNKFAQKKICLSEIILSHYACSLWIFASTFSVCYFFFYFAPILDNLFRLYAHPKTKSAKKMFQIVNDVISRRAKFKILFFSSCQCVEMNPNWN